jgi:hypothetical protein
MLMWRVLLEADKTNEYPTKYIERLDFVVRLFFQIKKELNVILGFLFSGREENAIMEARQRTPRYLMSEESSTATQKEEQLKEKMQRVVSASCQGKESTQTAIKLNKVIFIVIFKKMFKSMPIW